jgi:hypothetical protein
MKGLYIDYKLQRIINTIKDEINKKHNIELTFEEVKHIIESQYIATIDGMSKGYTIIHKHFGSFVATQARVKNLNKVYDRIGKPKTIQDTGFYRLTFDKNSTLICEETFTSNRKKDYLNKLNNNE